MINNRILNRILFIFLFIVIELSFISCTVKLIAEYDELTEKTVTELQKKINYFLIKLERLAETEDGKYEKYVDFYDQTKVELNSILIRAEAIPRNEITVELIKNMEETIDKLEKMHKEGLKSFEIKPIRDSINIQFSSIIKLELAKKRGKASGTEMNK